MRGPRPRAKREKDAENLRTDWEGEKPDQRRTTQCRQISRLRLEQRTDPPRTLSQDLFDFLIRQFRHVGNQQDPHQSEYFYIVDSLASVKSIVIICDLDGSEELVERVFRESFDTISCVLSPFFPFSFPLLLVKRRRTLME
jgi:hypothetical protein